MKALLHIPMLQLLTCQVFQIQNYKTMQLKFEHLYVSETVFMCITLSSWQEKSKLFHKRPTLLSIVTANIDLSQHNFKEHTFDIQVDLD